MLPSHFMFTKSVTVSIVELFLSSTGVKVNAQYCWDILLSQQMLTAIITSFITILSISYQQDSALVHLACNTVQLMQCKTLNFLSPKLRSNNIQSLNPMTKRFRQSYSSMSMSSPFFNPTTSPSTIYVY